MRSIREMGKTRISESSWAYSNVRVNSKFAPGRYLGLPERRAHFLRAFLQNRVCAICIRNVIPISIYIDLWRRYGESFTFHPPLEKKFTRITAKLSHNFFKIVQKWARYFSECDQILTLHNTEISLLSSTFSRGFFEKFLLNLIFSYCIHAADTIYRYFILIFDVAVDAGDSATIWNGWEWAPSVESEREITAPNCPLSHNVIKLLVRYYSIT